MKMNKDRMRFVLQEAVEELEKILEEEFSVSDMKSHIKEILDIDEDEYNYITGGKSK